MIEANYTKLVQEDLVALMKRIEVFQAGAFASPVLFRMTNAKGGKPGVYYDRSKGRFEVPRYTAFNNSYADRVRVVSLVRPEFWDVTPIELLAFLSGEGPVSLPDRVQFDVSWRLADVWRQQYGRRNLTLDEARSLHHGLDRKGVALRWDPRLPAPKPPKTDPAKLRQSRIEAVGRLNSDIKDRTKRLFEEIERLRAMAHTVEQKALRLALPDRPAAELRAELTARLKKLTEEGGAS